MNGTVVAYSLDAHAGVIKAENGRTYLFAGTEWRSVVSRTATRASSKAHLT